jgi:long-chain acyl-CoA synthetase
MPMPMPMADELNLGGMIDPTSDRDAIAFIDLAGSQAGGDARAYSRGEISDLANAVARGLRVRDLGRGVSVAILAENSVSYLTAYMGIMRAGMVAVPINYRQPARTIAHILADSDTRLIFADQGRLSLCPEAIPVINFAGDGAGTYR